MGLILVVSKSSINAYIKIKSGLDLTCPLQLEAFIYIHVAQ